MDRDGGRMMDRGELVRWGHITEKIIGAETEERECSTCQGSGTISGYELIHGMCPAEVSVATWEMEFDPPPRRPFVQVETLSCVVKGFHEGPHQAIKERPCMACWGMDIHRPWCSLKEENPASEGQMVVLFDNDGWYWVKPGWVE